jgi:hypothetical protein
MKIPDNCQWYDGLLPSHTFILLHGIYDGLLTIIIITSPKDVGDLSDEEVKSHMKANCIDERKIPGVNDYNIEVSLTALKISYVKNDDSRHSIEYTINNNNPNIKTAEEVDQLDEVIRTDPVTNDVKMYKFTDYETIYVKQDKIITVYDSYGRETAQLIYVNANKELSHNLIPMDDTAAALFPVKMTESSIESSAIASDLYIYSIQGEQASNTSANNKEYTLNLFGWIDTGSSAFYMHTNKGIFYVCTPPAYFTNIDNSTHAVCQAYKLTNSNEVAPNKKALVFTLLHATDIPVDYTTYDILKYVISAEDSMFNFGNLVAYNADSFNDITHIMKYTGTTDISAFDDQYNTYTPDSKTPFSITIDATSGTGIIGDGERELKFNLKCNTNTTCAGAIRLTMGGYRYSAFGIYLTNSPLWENKRLVYASGDIISPNIHILTNNVQQLYNKIEALSKAIDKLSDRLEVLEYKCGRIRRIEQSIYT